jgi:hypothetical protein
LTPSDNHQLWQAILDQLQMQMTQATFETWVKDTHVVSGNFSGDNGNGNSLVIGVKSTFAKDWLENRLFTTINRTVASILEQPVDIRFVVDILADDNGWDRRATNAPVAHSQPVEAELEEETTIELSPGQVIAQADYYKGFFEKGGAGFSQLAHHLTYFWMTLLGPAFFLWKWLDSDDPRSLKSIKPDYWSLPRKYSYTELAGKLNRRHGRYIAGDALECERSRLMRKAGQSCQSKEDCCGSPNYEFLRLKPHPKGQGLMCQHWNDGLLEILHQEGLAVVELNTGERKPTIQIWRMPPLITPYQYARLNEQIQSDYDHWLAKFGHLFNVPERKAWRSIEEPTLAPLMPGYDQAQVTDNFDQRRKKQEFLKDAFPNPHFVPCMARKF